MTANSKQQDLGLVTAAAVAAESAEKRVSAAPAASSSPWRFEMTVEFTEEMDQLRLHCFRLPASPLASTSRDQFDSRSLHLAVYYEDELAAYGRLTPGPDAVFETWTGGCASIPTGPLVLDLSRCCVTELRRQGGLLKLLCVKSLSYAWEHGYQFIVGAYDMTNQSLGHCFRQLGYEDSGGPVSGKNDPGLVGITMQPLVQPVTADGSHLRQLIDRYCSAHSSWSEWCRSGDRQSASEADPSRVQSKGYRDVLDQDLEAEVLRLKLQASATFVHELAALQRHLPASTSTFAIVDVGCGNGTFLSLVQERFTLAKCTGADRELRLLERARVLHPALAFHHVDATDDNHLTELLQCCQPDVILLRFVFQHLTLPEQREFLRVVKTAKKAHCRLLLIDSDDRLLHFCPASEPIARLMAGRGEMQKAAGGDRTVGGRLEQLLREQGYEDIQAAQVALSMRKVGVDSWSAFALPVILGGAHDPPSAVEERWQAAAKDWFATARTSPDYTASFTMYYVSGV